jgi:nucleoside-triphosphatase
VQVWAAWSGVQKAGFAAGDDRENQSYFVQTMGLKYDRTLITGKPGVGKTTLIKNIIGRMESINMAGFYTAEIRSKGSRRGFELQGLNGKRRTLAHVGIHSRHRVGKYGVDTPGFEAFLRTLDLIHPDVELIVIDEIGKMELYSKLFRSLVYNALKSDKQMLASIPIKGNDFIREIKQSFEIHLFEMTHGNRYHLPDEIVEGFS